MKKFNFSIFFLELILFLILIIPFSSAGKDGGGTPEPLFEFEGLHYQIPTGGWKLTPSSLLAIYLFGGNTECRIIDSDTSYFVPSKTNYEWDAFSSFADKNGISISPCAKKVQQDVLDSLADQQQQITTNMGADVYSALVNAVQTNNINGLTPEAKDVLKSLADSEKSREDYIAKNKHTDNLQAYFNSLVAKLDPNSNEYRYIQENFPSWLRTWQGYVGANPNQPLPNLYTMFGSTFNPTSNDWTLLLSVAWDLAYYKGYGVPTAHQDYLNSVNDYSSTLGRALTAQTKVVVGVTYEYGDNYGDYCGGGACIVVNSQTGETNVQTTPYFYCFTQDTLVLTTNGKVKIKDVKIEDKIISFDLNTNKFVESNIDKIIVHPQSVNWYYLIKTANSQVKATGIHPFYVGNREYKQADELKIGEVIYTNVNGKLVQEEILSKEKIELPNLITVYNLELEENSPRNYFANNYLVHNKA